MTNKETVERLNSDRVNESTATINLPVEEREAVIVADNLSKYFGATKALDKVNCRIAGASIFGLIGSNGAGKSTFLRLAAGVYRPTEGSMFYRGQVVFDNPCAKKDIVFVADQPYFHFDNLKKMSALYRSLYERWDQELYQELIRIFPIGEDQRLDLLSKGMHRQAALILAIAAKPRLLLMDEAFDGLDPVMRQNLKRILARQVADDGMTTLIASQNLRELEDFCDHVGLLHEGGLLFVEELDKLRLGLSKAQIAFREDVTAEQLKSAGLEILRFSARGSLIEILSRNTEAELRTILNQMNPLLLDVLPLTLEEVFIYELSRKSYVVSELLA
ncbi:MAG: ABC transporter ATP-binding protein [Clostridiaceae bacterium]|jgi:ABC-2 type transport system ATP-binding protein|nr:ABC transporter ATP-binding protein [Clostridia bacterium]MBP6161648.1 ABC transporter ATP-binding protein [Clostridia bacterium]MBP6949553.1 ABC transporter ATP-binding protein [Clostridia bacterium]NMA36179.1 ABC transporter ATP-binding protein [Clostridiaceae bacterium]